MKPAWVWMMFMLWMPALYASGIAWGDPDCCDQTPFWASLPFGVLFWGVLIAAFGLAAWTLATLWNDGRQRTWGKWTLTWLGLLALVALQPFVVIVIRWVLWPPGI